MLARLQGCLAVSVLGSVRKISGSGSAVQVVLFPSLLIATEAASTSLALRIRIVVLVKVTGSYAK